MLATEGSAAMVWVVLLIAGLTTLLCVGLHYEVIHLLVSLGHRREIKRHRTFLIAVILVLFVTHLVEAVLFAGAYQLLFALGDVGAGRLVGDYDGTFGDAVYFSLAVYTTVGFGDITPVGPVRLFVGVEALAGLVLITWSASFTFLIMQRIFSREFKPIGGE